MTYTIGIDLGTTNSVVSIYEHNDVKIISNEEGDHLTPSVVYVKSGNEIIVGQKAKNQSLLHPDNTISSIKRVMGSNETYTIEGENYTPEQISGFILKKLRQDAENYLQTEISDAIITVPAYFNDNQRKATIDAGKIAGLNVKRIINEPTASCLAFGIYENNYEGVVLVYDLGGGTFDVSILDVGDGVYNVVSTAGDNQLGGLDFDQRLVKLVCDSFQKDYGIDLQEDKFALQKLFEECEKSKKTLSEHEMTRISIPFISANKKGPLHLDYEITRGDFEALIEDLIDYTIQLTERAVRDAGLELGEIDKVLLVGGSTRIPVVQQKLTHLFPQKIEKKINPDECVSVGAAIQAGIIDKKIQDVVLVDVTPLSLGIEVEGGLFVPIIQRNSPIPMENHKIFTTIADNQRIVEINVFQGERKICSENVYLGKFILNDIRNAKAGEPKIKVAFSIDVDGILTVSAVDEDTKAQQKITIDSYRKLDQKEINRIIEKARDMNMNDRFFEQLVKIKSKIKMLAKKLEERVQNTKMDKDMHQEINFLFEDIQTYIDTDNIDKLRDIYESLSFYSDELDFQKEKFISNHLLKGE